jgi:hypothetical protein
MPDAQGPRQPAFVPIQGGGDTWDAVIAGQIKTLRSARLRVWVAPYSAYGGGMRGLTANTPAYWAADERGCELLRRNVGALVRAVVTRRLLFRARQRRKTFLFSLGAAAHDLFVLGFREERERLGNADWRPRRRFRGGRLRDCRRCPFCLPLFFFRLLLL